MKENFLLKTENAAALYREAARDLPIIDYHNHLSVSDIKKDKKYEDLCELWLASDPYKHRLMRIMGIDEHFITGQASPREKLRKYCEAFPYLAGTPVYDWSRMELFRIFGIEQTPSKENADYIFDKALEMLRSPEFSARGILSRFSIEKQFPVAALTDELTDFGGDLAPSLRADALLSPTEELRHTISERSGISITDTDSYIAAIAKILDAFDQKGCRFADHALDAGFFDGASEEQMKILIRLGGEYAKRGWTLLLHMDAKRKTSPRLARIAGPAGGYAAVGGALNISALADMLAKMEERGGLPATVLFPLNQSDFAPISVLQGSFPCVQLGAAWWWCDHAMGIRHALDCTASYGVLSEFIGMTTDSRSILSFVRHDYFRRILCSYLDEKNERDEWGLSYEMQADILRGICYENAKKRIL